MYLMGTLSSIKKPAEAGFLLSEHIAWRYVFERLAIVIEHAYQEYAKIH